MNQITYETQLKKVGLDIPENWKGDIRPKFQSMFQPLIENTNYYFKVNTTDSSAKILELHKNGERGRIMGINAKRNGSVGAFFNPTFYKNISANLELPGNQKEYRSQPHMNLTLEQVWNVLCYATGKIEYIW